MTDYINDINILSECKNNFNSKCECIILSDAISKYSRSVLTPYYCWYEPCLNPDNHRTSLIKYEQTLCNITTCEVKIGDVVMEGGSLIINNNCASSISNLLNNITQQIPDFVEDKILLVNFIIPILLLLTIIIICKY